MELRNIIATLTLKFQLDFVPPINLTRALLDTGDELRVGEGYIRTDRKQFWTKVAYKQMFELRENSLLLKNLKSYQNEDFNVSSFSYSIINNHLQKVFSNQSRNFFHIRNYCGSNLVKLLEMEISWTRRELENFYDLT